MEFPFDPTVLFPQLITRTVGGRLPSCTKESSHDNRIQMFANVVNEMGVASAKAQGLRAPITTFQKLKSSNQSLYIMRDDKGQSGSVVGILKTGRKKLFLNDCVGVQHEVEPLCVLDFYVHESRQRGGCGKVLFEAMMKAEGLKPFEVAIDRPSPKFLGFLRKHYQLNSYVKQANNYVVFEQFFSTCKDVGPRSRRFSLPQTTHNTSLHLTPERRTSLGHSKDKELSFFSPATRPHLQSHQVSPSNPSPLTCMPVRTRNTGTGANELQEKTSSKENGPHFLNDSQAEFNWSPTIGNKQPLNSNVYDFNIITGRPIKDSYHRSNRIGSYGNSADRRSYTLNMEHSTTDRQGFNFSLKDSQSTSNNELSKAPYLNIRRNSKHTKSLSLGALSSRNPLGQHVGPESVTKYSRHRLEQARPRLSSGTADSSSARIGVSSLTKFVAATPGVKGHHKNTKTNYRS